MQDKKVEFVFLILIILFGAFIRLISLETSPNGFYVDEAATGYNAWSILLTGKDEYGKQFPLAFRFFGSFTPPLYTYLTALVFFFSGPTIFATRLISALSGIAIIPIAYFFIKTLNFKKNKWMPLIGAFLIAIAPWSIFYSRIGYEVHLAFTVYSLGVLFIVLGLNRSLFLIPGFSLISLSTNIYHAQKLLAPLTIIFFSIVFKNFILQKSHIRNFLIGVLGFGIFFIPQLILMFTPAGTTRALATLYTGQNPAEFLREFSSRYVSYFSPRNLFFEGDPDLQRSIPDLSVLYPWMVVPFLIGIFALLRHPDKEKSKFLIMLAALTPIPAALAGDPFSSQRSLPLLLPVIVAISLGVAQILKSKYKFFWVLLFFMFTSISLIYLYRSFAVLLPNERAKTWGYGYRKLTDEINKRPDQKFTIDPSRLKPPYIELAFFLKYPPQKLQARFSDEFKDKYYHQTNFENNYELEKISIRPFFWQQDLCKDQILIGDEYAFSEKQIKEYFLVKEFEIRSPIDEIIFIGYKTNPKISCKKSYSEAN